MTDLGAGDGQLTGNDGAAGASQPEFLGADDEEGYNYDYEEHYEFDNYHGAALNDESWSWSWDSPQAHAWPHHGEPPWQLQHDGEGARATSPEAVTPPSSTSSRRRRGRRGRGDLVDNKPRWRSGQVPQPPEFDGDVETNPFCLRHYKRSLLRWVRITKEFLPPNEQALRALDQMKGAAALEFEEVDDDRYDTESGIQTILLDLEKNFGEKEIYRRGGIIREYETLTRVQGESITAFIRRFRLIERKLQDAQVAAYPDESRAIKFLDGLRLDEKTTSHILLAAGNRYDFQSILDAVRMQFPAGLTLTGMARPGAQISSTGALNNSKRGRGRGRGSGWLNNNKSSYNKMWHTSHETEWHEPDWHETWETVPGAVPETEAYDEQYYDAAENEDQQQQEGHEDDGFVYEGDDEQQDDGEAQDEEQPVPAEALTATSKQLAGQKAARGYYDPGKGKKGSGKSKGKGSSGSFKGKGGKPSHGGKGSSFGGKSNGQKGQGKTQRQQRFANAQCLGCGSDNALHQGVPECDHLPGSSGDSSSSWSHG